MKNLITVQDVAREFEGSMFMKLKGVKPNYFHLVNEVGNELYIQAHSLTKDIVISAVHNERITESVTAVGNNRPMIDVIAAIVDTFDAIAEMKEKGFPWVCYVRKIKDSDL